MHNNPLNPLNEKNFFFCFGLPKSGTTFLQLILDSHPKIQCPPEVSFTYLLEEFPKMMDKFNNISLEFNDHKGLPREKVQILDKKFVLYELRNLVLNILKKNIKNNSNYFGAKDNGISKNFTHWFNLFNKEKFIGIVRDPRQVSISMWHHNLRVAGEEWKKKFTFKDVLTSTFNHFNENFFLISEIEKNYKDRLLLIKYEDLREGNIEILKKIFNFLGINIDKSMLHEIYKKNHFSKYKDGKFFRNGESEEWRKQIDKKLLRDVTTQRTKNLLDIFNYPKI